MSDKGNDDRRTSSRLPIRLMVTYDGVETLIAQYTRSISYGGMDFNSAKHLEPGTQFVFTMSTPGVNQPLEVRGTVAHTTPRADGTWKIGIRYSFDDLYNRQTLQQLIERIKEVYRWDYIRREPRIPVTVPIQLQGDLAPHYEMKDISRGGAQIAAQKNYEPPPVIANGLTVGLNIPDSSGERCMFSGTVVWRNKIELEGGAPFEVRFGVVFEDLSQQAHELLARLTNMEFVPDLIMMEI